MTKKDKIEMYSVQYHKGHLSQLEIAKLVGCDQSTVSYHLGSRIKHSLTNQKLNKNNLGLINFAIACRTIKESNSVTIGEFYRMSETNKLKCLA